MDFKNAKELLALCEERKLCISDVMRSREIEKVKSPARSVTPG